MSYTGTHFDGPLISGDNRYTSEAGTGTNTGFCLLTQMKTLSSDSAATAFHTTFQIPTNSWVVDWLFDTTTPWNSITATIAVGTATLVNGAGNQAFAGGGDGTAAGRVRPTFNGTQLSYMSNNSSNLSAIASISTNGISTLGVTNIIMVYAQTDR